MQFNKVLKLAFIMVLVSTMGACSLFKSNDNKESGQTSVSNASSQTSSSRSSQQSNTAQSTRKAADLRDQKVVYFEFDKASLRSDTRAVLEAHAKYLVKNASKKIVLQGHADERGTREYNIALGERRALTVARFLKLKGVSSSQLDTVSYGEEKPVATGHSERSWAKNRRVEIVYN